MNEYHPSIIDRREEPVFGTFIDEIESSNKAISAKIDTSTLANDSCMLFWTWKDYQFTDYDKYLECYKKHTPWYRKLKHLMLDKYPKKMETL